MDNNVSNITVKIGSTTHTVASNFDYLPFGPMKSLTHGNGLTRTLTYNDDITTGAIQDLDYGYDYRGNIENITNNLNASYSQSFTYDALNRLDIVTSSSGNHNYNFDGNGNRTSTNSVAGVNYSYSASI